MERADSTTTKAIACDHKGILSAVLLLKQILTSSLKIRISLPALSQWVRRGRCGRRHHKVSMSNTSLTAKMDSGKYTNTKAKAVPIVPVPSQKPYDLKPKPYFPVAQRMVPDDVRVAVIGQADPNEHIEDRLIEENFQSD